MTKETSRNTDSNRHIDDAGEFVPYARKHLAREEGKSTQDAITLKELWPEPDWRAERDAGRPAEVLAYLFMVYDGLAKAPRATGCRTSDKGMTDKDWRDTYQDAIELLRQLFEETQTLDQAKQINERMAAKLGFTIKTIPKLPDYEAAVFWAAGRGKRNLRAPGNRTARQDALARWLPVFEWPDSDELLQCGLVPIDLTDGTWRIARVNGNRFEWESELVVATEEEAIALLRERIAKEKETKKTLRRCRSSDKERQGPDWRNGQDVDAKTLMQEFGLRAVQFGNSLSQTQRQAWLNESFDALADLADIVGMKRRWIGLGGLALAFGARGTGKAIAHYEPSLRAINLTREKGAGSLAHEWAHGLDHRMTGTLGKYDTYATRMVHLRHLIKEPRQIAIADPLERICRYGHRRGSESVFLSNATKLSWIKGNGDYWHKIEEMFARGFESFVQDALQEKQRSSPWLVHGTLESDFPGDGATSCPYPTGEERKDMFTHYSALMHALASK